MASSSHAKSSKLGQKQLKRRPSILDEYKIYFSHWLSPFRKKHIRNPGRYHHQTSKSDASSEERLGTGNHQTGTYSRGYDYKEQEDVDAQAEKFIAMKHKNFKLTKWMSRNS